ncbi:MULTISPECIES: phosphotransferase [unclassified Paenibacillus]|uniref:phosphotransferase enzyme family protein n=1 Tax=unclassified Paenibacillus TaxID=185978 RepID=UPI00095582F0|nr:MULTISPECIES: phosphotransferase [unclassified Paenibacillus]ASS68315.1 phosphotransferase [Paenibacillus sp. RUD330]SIR28659.1 Ser/Thr protein kinase RdoA involved in Cpx stress response, MazF antagonist [Paenibacillus sp. RU4X]SIR40962.1 Ser/Thr protein kinase RdoA involved in Cpx stress response, MazF antagonist [Paenibacillus sp. RU4T]
MEASVEKLFGPERLEDAALRFGLQGNPKKLGDFENYIYEMQTAEGVPVILRLTHSSHRSQEEIEAELDFLRHLEAEGCGKDIASGLASPSGSRIEKIMAADGSCFYASLFRKAPGGRAVPDSEAWNRELFAEWGAVTARFHNASAKLDRKLARRQWSEDDLIANATAYLQDEDPGVIAQLASVLDRLHALPRPEGSYGLLHGDIHNGNFFVHEGRIMVFDFDDLEYSWYIHDVAIPLYYALSSRIPDRYGADRDAYAADFFLSFLQGYRSERKMPEEWLDVLGLFLEMRDLTLYTVLAKKLSPEELTEGITAWMEPMKERIVAGTPIVSLDFRELAAAALS